MALVGVRPSALTTAADTALALPMRPAGCPGDQQQALDVGSDGHQRPNFDQAWQGMAGLHSRVSIRGQRGNIVAYFRN